MKLKFFPHTANILLILKPVKEGTRSLGSKDLKVLANITSLLTCSFEPIYCNLSPVLRMDRSN